jgi:hypothetical protein
MRMPGKSSMTVALSLGIASARMDTAIHLKVEDRRSALARAPHLLQRAEASTKPLHLW